MANAMSFARVDTLVRHSNASDSAHQAWLGSRYKTNRQWLLELPPPDGVLIPVRGGGNHSRAAKS